VDEIRVLHAGSRGAYGVPRIHAALRRAVQTVNAKEVERRMRKHRIVGITRRRRPGLTRQAKRAVSAADLIGRDFTAPRPGMRLAGDMTELTTLEGKLYLATCIDLATREVVGWAMSDHHRAALPVAALWMAAGRGGLEDSCIMHADHGSEYMSDEFRTGISTLRMRRSMGRVDSCYDNAAAESRFAVLEAEIGTTVRETREAARADVFRYIEIEYNRSRLRRHPEYGDVTPLETRTLLRQDLSRWISRPSNRGEARPSSADGIPCGAEDTGRRPEPFPVTRPGGRVVHVMHRGRPPAQPSAEAGRQDGSGTGARGSVSSPGRARLRGCLPWARASCQT
jgi:putative transposase